MAIPPATSGRSKVVFGGLLMCSSGLPVVLRHVRYESEVESTVVRGAVRQIPPVEERTHVSSTWWNPISAVRGDLSDEAVKRKLKGRVLPIEGVVVDNKCGKREPGMALTELLTSVHADRHGASINQQVIEYDAGGQTYSVTVPWRLVICGPGVSEGGCTNWP